MREKDRGGYLQSFDPPGPGKISHSPGQDGAPNLGVHSLDRFPLLITISAKLGYFAGEKLRGHNKDLANPHLTSFEHSVKDELNFELHRAMRAT